jgi:hypothetical protein
MSEGNLTNEQSFSSNSPKDGTSENLKGILATIPERFKGLAERVYFSEKGKSRADAVKLKCLDCVGYEETTLRIKSCSCVNCPLHSFRPYQDEVE